MIGTQVDHDLASRAAELAHLPGIDARGEAGEVVTGGSGIIARGVEPDEKRHIAGQGGLVHHTGHSTHRIKQYAGCLACQIANNVRLGVAQNGVSDLGLFFGRIRQDLADAAALIAGNHHNRTVFFTNLVVASKVQPSSG